MKKLLLGVTVISICGLFSCTDHAKVDDCVKGIEKCDSVKAGRIWTHTKKSHVVHQEITAEEKEMVKDHITNETTFGSSSASIDSVGAKMINDSRKQK